MSRVSCALVGCIALSVSSPAAAQHSTYLDRIDADAPAHVFRLPPLLKEISGLTIASKNSVYAHNDEHGIVHELDLRSGDIIRSFALGAPTAKADFEGVALMNGFLYLVTSKGLIYEARPADHRTRTPFNIYDTGLGKVCEVEGVTPDGADGLILGCKRSTLSRNGDPLILYRWSMNSRLGPREPWLKIDVPPGARKDGDFRAAALERDPDTGHILIADSSAGAILEITASGKVAAWRKMGGRHPQTEGVAIMPNGVLVTADEGGANNGVMTVYNVKE